MPARWRCNAANNLFGWQVVDPSTVRADQWQAMFDTYIADIRDLDINDYFETHNPTAQAQLMERMVEAIRKGYWDASEATRRKLVERWRALAADHGVAIGEEPTLAFIDRLAAGFGLAAATAQAAEGGQAPADAQAAAPAGTPQPVSGQVLEEMPVAGEVRDVAWLWLPLSLMLGLIGLGVGLQWRAGTGRA